MRKIKELIAIIIVIILILLILIIALSNRKKESDYYQTEFERQSTYVANNKIDYVKNKNKYYAIKSIVEEYVQCMYYINYDIKLSTELTSNAITKEDKEKALLKIKDILSSEYVLKYNITDKEIYQMASEYKENIVEIQSMYVDERTGSINTYIINSEIQESKQPLVLMIITDSKNMTYEVYPYDFMKEHGYDKLKIGDSIDIEKGEIDKKSYNVFNYTNISDETMANNYIIDYKKNTLNNIQKLYKHLDEDYRNARFENIEEFEQYINENRSEILKIKLDKYQKTIKDGYTQYVCIDKNGNYLIFNETATMQYTMLLDTYTIDIPEFTEKYNIADDMTKVGMNIEKINAALNAKDYKYIYSKLPDSFKNNYFNTLESFKNYMQNNFYNKNTITYDEFSNEGKNYMFKVKIQNAESISEYVEKTIIMQLKEGTDFVFSFNV